MRIANYVPSPPLFGVSLSIALVITSVACADDSTATDSNDASETGETGNTETAGTEGDDMSGDGDGDPSGDGDGDGDGDPTGDGDGDGDPLPTEITVAGDVMDFLAMSGVPDVTITVKDMPEFETVTDVNGLYEFEGMPPSTEVFFLLSGNEDAYWGGIRPAMLPAQDTDDLQLAQVSNVLIDLQLGLVQQQNPDVFADETKSVIIVRLLQPTAAGGAVVTFDPPPPPNTFFGTSTPSNNPVLNSYAIDSQLLPFWVAFNVEPDDAGGAYEITVDHPMRECEVLHPVFPTRSRYVTLVDVDCPPPP